MDKVATSMADRRRPVFDVIRGARKTLALSLFRCNDADVFADRRLFNAVADRKGVAL